MTKTQALQLSEQRKVRTVWDDETEKWYFLVVDVVGVLTNSIDPTAYFRKLRQLSEILNCRGMEPRRFREYRQVYLVYPTLGNEIESFIQKNSLQIHSFGKSLIWRSASAKLQTPENQIDEIWRMASAKFEEWETSPTKLFNRLNFSSLLYLTSIEDPLKRAFYEQEAIRGCWTVKELDRQVSSLYFERMGLSKDKLAMQKLTMKDSRQLSKRMDNE